MKDGNAVPAKKDQSHLEFSYDMGQGQQNAHVTVNSRSYYIKTLTFANELLDALRVAIPFPCTEASEPELHILAGDRVRGMLSVEFDIAFVLSYEEALAKLEAAGFKTPTEFYLG